MKTAEYFPGETFPFEREKYFKYGEKVYKVADIKRMVIEIIDKPEAYRDDIALTMLPLFGCYRILVLDEILSRKEAQELGLAVVSADADGYLKPYEFIKSIVQKMGIRQGYESINNSIAEVFYIADDDGGRELRNLLLWYLVSCIVWGKQYFEHNYLKPCRCKECEKVFIYQNQGGRNADFCSADCRSLYHNKSRNKRRNEKKEKGAAKDGNNH